MWLKDISLPDISDICTPEMHGEMSNVEMFRGDLSGEKCPRTNNVTLNSTLKCFTYYLQVNVNLLKSCCTPIRSIICWTATNVTCSFRRRKVGIVSVWSSLEVYIVLGFLWAHVMAVYRDLCSLDIQPVHAIRNHWIIVTQVFTGFRQPRNCVAKDSWQCTRMPCHITLMNNIYGQAIQCPFMLNITWYTINFIINLLINKFVRILIMPWINDCILLLTAIYICNCCKQQNKDNK